jgi:dienelactone hydrolase
VSAEQIKGLIEEMTKAGADWQLINYGGTVRSFTNPDPDSLGSPALKYNELSDKRSWKAMTDFFDEIFAA